MKRELIITADGSHSIHIEELRESFHSQNGSIQESEHTFINAGLQYLSKTFVPNYISIFEVGFGTGLNALLTEKWCRINKIACSYHCIDAFPLENELWQNLNYCSLVEDTYQETFEQLHHSKWNETSKISEFFTITKHHQDLKDFKAKVDFNLVYFDAFAPSVQPELWTLKVFENIYKSMTDKSVLVTYSSAGAPRRSMAKVGFWIDEIKGAKGKREMTRALKW